LSTAVWLAVIFGFVFVALIFAVAVWLVVINREPPHASLFFFRVILALAAAGVGAVLPGLLNVTINGYGVAVSATAGLALFVIVYFLNPPGLISRTRTYEVGPLEQGHRRTRTQPKDGSPS
jgi:hypothetical protein